MKRRHFVSAACGTLLLDASGRARLLFAADNAPGLLPPDGVASPLATKLNVKPVMTSLVHTGVWEGPCRWQAQTVEEEKAGVERSFAGWREQLAKSTFATRGDVNLMEPARITFDESFVIPESEFEKLKADAAGADVLYLLPAGSSIAAFELGERFGRPILMDGLNCRKVDIAAYTRSRGNEAFVAADAAELDELVTLLRARKVFRSTKVLFPTDRGLPAVASVGSVSDLDDLAKRLGIEVKTIGFKELTAEMDAVSGDAEVKKFASEVAGALVEKADKSFIEKQYVAKSLLFYRAVRNLMARHGCDGFTIECFEFCSSRLPDRWQITPCLIHSLQRDLGHASSCEGDLGSLLAMRMLMSVAGRSCHQGNSDPREGDTFRINHSVPARKMNGFDQPDLPYQLGRFVSGGWGAKMVVDFMNNQEKTITVARVDPTATRVVLFKGELTGSDGWGKDNLGCSVEALIRNPNGSVEKFLRKRLEYGNHLQWVYGDHTRAMTRLGEMLGLKVEVVG